MARKKDTTEELMNLLRLELQEANNARVEAELERDAAVVALEDAVAAVERIKRMIQELGR